MYSDFISAKGLEQLRKYKYVSSPATFMDKALNPFWEAVAKLMPNWMAPNLITLIGFFWLISGCLCCVLARRTFLARRPNPVLLFCAFAVFVYQTLDAVDGKQARRLGRSSALGQLFDHGVDCVGIGLWSYMLLVALGCREDAFAVMFAAIAAMLFFYPPQFAEYFTHTLMTSSHGFGVTELQLSLIALLTIASLVDARLFSTKILEMPLSRWLSVAMAALAAVFAAFIFADGYALAPSNLLFFTMLAPFAALIALSISLFRSAAGRTPTLLFFICMFAFHSLTLKMIVSSLTRMPYSSFHFELIPLAVLLALACLGMKGRALLHASLWCLSANFAMLAAFAVNVLRQMSAALQRPIFHV